MGRLLTHVVCRSFGDDTIGAEDPLQRRLAGECVSALHWRNTESLEVSRRIMLLPEGLEPVSDSLGRLWCDMDSLLLAGREPLDGLVDGPSPDLAEGQEQAKEATEKVQELPATEDFVAPVRIGKPAGQYTKYRLWDGSIVMGKAAALDAHEAGVRTEMATHQT